MKKILQVTTVSRTINAFLIPHIKYLEKMGFNVEIASNIDLEISNELKNLKFNKIDFSRNPFSFSNLRALKQIKKINKKNKYDIIHVHTPVAAFITRLALRKEDIKIIYTAHGFHFFKGSSKLNWLLYYTIEKIAAKWTDCIVTINNEDFNVAKSKFKCDRNEIFKINGIGLNIENYKPIENNIDFKESLNLKKDDFVITIVAELIKRKNHRQIINAIERIKDKKNIKVLFVGNGNLTEELNQYIKDKKMEENFILLGYRNDVNKIISISDVLGLFSYQEGLPRNLMEGMAQSKPLICTNIRGNNDLVKNNYNGILVEVNDYDDTAKQILRLYKNKDLVKRLGKNGYKELKKYDVKNVLLEVDEIYEHILV